MSEEALVVFAVVSGTGLVVLLLVFIVYFILLYRKKQEVFELEREQLKQAHLQAQIEIKEETLANISRELHDNFGQVASLIKMNLVLLTNHVKEEGEENLEQSKDLIKQHVQDIRSLSVSLKAENLKRFGLLGMLKKELERYEKAGQLKIELKAPENLEIESEVEETFVYRMLQEILNNVIKHARATEVSIDIVADPSTKRFIIKDNGKGFDINTVNLGSGILNIEERCKFINASFKLNSSPGKGTEYIINI